MRFYRGFPRKIGGYKQILGGLPNVPRGLFNFPQSPDFNLYFADYQSLKFVTMDQDSNVISPVNDVTPASFVPSVNNVWTFDVMFSTISNENMLIAHAAPNLLSISNTVDTPVYFGRVGDTTPLVETGISAAGGIVVLHPFLFTFGTAGDVKWSNANDPTTIMGEARIASQKVVAGLPTRAGNSSPGGLLWTLDSLIRVTQVGQSEILFRFDTITNQSSILSSRSVIEYDGRWLWAGIDRFLFYDGSVREVPNDMNLNFFYLNLNYAQRQKVWATKVPQYGEIWWYYPSGTNIECDSALIYNIRENSWYNTTLARGIGYFEQVCAVPIWADSYPDVGGLFSIWQHEKGLNKNVGGVLTSIPSFFETGNIAWVANGPTGQWTGTEKWVDLYRIEPDFIQNGDMTLTVRGKEYARSPDVDSDPYVFTPDTEKIDLHEQRREMRLRFSSDEIDSFYQLGQTIAVIRYGDDRP